jgi:hypothetical protein
MHHVPVARLPYALQDIGSAVGGAIFHYKDLQIPERLAQQASHRLSDIIRPVEEDGYATDKRSGTQPRFPFLTGADGGRT